MLLNDPRECKGEEGVKNEKKKKIYKTNKQ